MWVVRTYNHHLIMIYSVQLGSSSPTLDSCLQPLSSSSSSSYDAGMRPKLAPPLQTLVSEMNFQFCKATSFLLLGQTGKQSKCPVFQNELGIVCDQHPELSCLLLEEHPVWPFQFFFSHEFCDVAELAMTHRKIQPILATYEI